MFGAKAHCVMMLDDSRRMDVSGGWMTPASSEPLISVGRVGVGPEEVHRDLQRAGAPIL